MYEAKEVIEVLRLHHSEKLYQALSEIIDDPISPADEIRKYKSLFDEGIISEEEFRKRRRNCSIKKGVFMGTVPTLRSLGLFASKLDG